MLAYCWKSAVVVKRLSSAVDGKHSKIRTKTECVQDVSPGTKDLAGYAVLRREAAFLHLRLFLAFVGFSTSDYCKMEYCRGMFTMQATCSPLHSFKTLLVKSFAHVWCCCNNQREFQNWIPRSLCMQCLRLLTVHMCRMQAMLQVSATAPIFQKWCVQPKTQGLNTQF